MAPPTPPRQGLGVVIATVMCEDGIDGGVMRIMVVMGMTAMVVWQSSRLW